MKQRVTRKKNKTSTSASDAAITPEEVYARIGFEKDFIPPGSSNRPGTLLKATHITIHNTANTRAGADARMHAEYLKGPEARAREVSWHFTIDDRRCVQHLPRNEVGWHAGPGNASSVAIEICENAGINQPLANEHAALLTGLLMRQLGIMKENIFPHKQWTGKNCPGRLMKGPGGFRAFVAAAEFFRSQISAGPVSDDVAPRFAVHTGIDDFSPQSLAMSGVEPTTSQMALFDQLLGQKVRRIAELERELETVKSMFLEAD